MAIVSLHGTIRPVKREAHRDVYSFSQPQLKIGYINFKEIMPDLPESDSAQAFLEKESKELKGAYTRVWTDN